MKRAWRLTFGACCLAAAACGKKPDAAIEAPATAPATAPTVPPPVAAPVFVDVAESAGLTATNHTGIPDQKDWILSSNGGGAIVLDYDQDGLMDLVVVDGTMLTESGELKYDDDWRTRVYHNDGNLRFTDVTKKSGVDLKAFGIGGASCDYDGDGRPDFYVCCWGGDHLFHNRGDGTFEDVAEKAGVRGSPDDASTACCWGDVNGDGIPDLYVSNYVDLRSVIDSFRAKHIPPRNVVVRDRFRVLAGPMGLPAQKDRLYFGAGDGTFREVTDSNLPPQNPPRYGYQPVMTDLDGDGDLDIFVANDNGPNYLWNNDGGGKFVDRASESGVAVDEDGKQQASMGVDVADVNRDGRLDIVVTNFFMEHTTLYVQQPARAKVCAFRDLSDALGVAAPSRTRVCWGVKLLDYDDDGELDLFVAAGHVYGEIPGFEEASGAPYRQRCLLQRNVGPPSYRFEEVSGQAGPPFQERRVWRGAAFADFDNDGDLDVFVTALNDRPALLRNDVGNRNGFLVFRLVGKGKLRDPCGARVTIYLTDGRPRMEELHHGVSFACDNDPRLFFGLGKETAAKRVEVRWPNGETQTFENVAGRKFYVVEQGKNALLEDRR